MATNFPSSLDAFSNPASSDQLSTGHAGQHDNLNDSVAALEAKVGATGSAVSTSLDNRMANGYPLFTALTTGVSTMPREVVVASNIPTATGVMLLKYFTSGKSFTSTQVRVSSGGVAAAATPTLIRLGLYTIDGASAGALVASTPNDTTLFAATFTDYTKSWSVSYPFVIGQRYALGLLIVTGVAAPNMDGAFVTATESAQAPRLTGQITALSDLPSTFVNGSVANANVAFYGAMI